MLPAFLTTVLFSLSAVTATKTTKLMGGTEANFWRLCLATLFLAVYAYGFGLGMGGAAFAVFFISGCVGFGIGDVALFQAYPRIGTRLTILLVQCLAAPFAALTEWLWLDTRLTVAEMLCSVTILAGVGLAIAPGKHLEVTRRNLWIGIFFGVVAAYGQGFGAVLSRKAYEVAALAGDDIDGITAAFQRALGGIIVSGLFVFIVKRQEIWHHFCTVTGRPSDAGKLKPVNPDRWRKGWWLVVTNGLAGPALGVSCYQWALKDTPTGVVLPIVALTPLVVIPFTRYLEGERPTKRSLLGVLQRWLGAA
jgi:drug/metabolite transporter (DMT)-like permease